ncbi:hypothetical protein [Mycoplasma struthionis]|uniref:Lipoprotein-associated type-17 domain-containing protein n=1 Tax=Mycoplasma struthionis TaxID=538220 RepID=A0A502M219_9MOLU|nr:hypothetical protein [Mycoplasma struthionis]TPI01935.1 hypothetical protein FJM01_01595 [Mycoplasma struthionis]
MKKKVKILYTLSFLAFALPATAISCIKTDKKEEISKDLNEKLDKTNFIYENKNNVDVLNSNEDAIKIENNDGDLSFKISNFKKQPKLNSVSFDVYIKKDNKISETRKMVINDFAITENYLNTLLDDTKTTLKLGDASNDGSEETVKQLNVWHLVEGQGAIQINIKNPDMYIPENLDLIVDYSPFDDSTEVNSKFNGTVDLEVQLNYEKENKKVSSKKKMIKFENQLQPGFSVDYLTKFKKLTFTFDNLENISVSQIQEGNLSDELKSHLKPAFDGNLEAAKAFFDKHNITFENIRVDEVFAEERKINLLIDLKMPNTNEEWGKDTQFELTGLKEVQKATNEQVAEFVKKLTHGDFYFGSLLNENNNEIPLRYSDNNNITQESPILDQELLSLKGITDFNVEELNKAKYDKNSHKLITTLHLNGQEYTVETTLSRPTVDMGVWASEVGDQLTAEANTINAISLNVTNLKFKKLNWTII